MNEDDPVMTEANGKDLNEILKNLGDNDDNEEFCSFGEDLICTDYMDPTEFMESAKGKYDNDNHLNVLHLNIDSLSTKFDALRELIGSDLSSGEPFFHLIAISETHLRSEGGKSNYSSLSDDEIKFALPNYCFVGKSRKNFKKRMMWVLLQKGFAGFYFN